MRSASVHAIMSRNRFNRIVWWRKERENDMLAVQIEAFTMAGRDVMASITGDTPLIAEVMPQTTRFTTRNYSLVVGMSGQYAGQMIISMSAETAQALASTMMMSPVEEMDEMAMSALSELANMIGGTAISQLSTQGVHCDITPPTLIEGEAVKFSTQAPAFRLPFSLGVVGSLDLYIALAAAAE